MNQKSLFLNDLMYLLVKLLLIGIIVVILFTFCFGICRSSDTSMNPAVKAGDLVIYYRLQKDYRFSDAIVLECDGQTQIRRVVAVAGDTVDITEEGLVINGYVQQENEIYTETLPYTEGITFPVTVGEGEVFVLGDNRTNAKDSRIYGTVKISETKGSVMTILRRREI